MTNGYNKSYWQGYRDAKFFSMLYAVENIDAIKKSIEFDTKSERYRAGFNKALKALERELKILLDKDASYRS